MDVDTQKFAALKEELRKDLEALERVERLMAAKNGKLSALPDDRQLPLMPPDARRTDSIDQSDEDNGPATSLRGKIEEIINAEPGNRWTTQKVLAKLNEIKFPLKAQKPIYSVGQSLNGLVNQNRIKLARKGAGSEPNIYKGLPTVEPSHGASRFAEILMGDNMNQALSKE